MRNQKMTMGVLTIGLLATVANLSCKQTQEHGGKTTPKEHGGTAAAPSKEHGGTATQ